MVEKTNDTVKISVMVSGGGTNLQALIGGVKEGLIKNARIGLVLSSKENAFALERARRAGIETTVISKTDYPDEEERTDMIIDALAKADTDLVVTAGYMSILNKRVCSAYAGRMINIHPSLLPRHGGVGYYGIKVHEAVLSAGDAKTGATVHYVDDQGVDSGEIIMQRSIEVKPGDTPETLQKRVLEEVEHKIIIEATNMVVQKILAEKREADLGVRK